MPTCKSNQILRAGFCSRTRDAPKRFNCNDLSSDDCKEVDKCKWTPSTCVTDTGKKGKTPLEKQWSKGIELKGEPFSKFFPLQKVVMTVDACEKAGKKMRNANIPYKSANGKLQWLNINPHYSKKERQDCLKGLQKAYDKI